MPASNGFFNKKVLMICYFFPPCAHVGALRSSKFVKYLGNFGWNSVVLRASRGTTEEYDGNPNVEIHSTFSYDLTVVLRVLITVYYFCVNTGKRFFAMFKQHNSRTNNGKQFHGSSVKAIGGLGIANYLKSWLLLPDSCFFWIVFALPKALWLSRKCDVIYSSSSPYSAHVLGLLVKKLTHKPWVADYRDEWSLDSYRELPTRFHKWLGEKLDKSCVKNADIVINVTEVITSRAIDKFGEDKEKFVTIHNGYDEDDIAKFRKTKAPTDTLVMTSIGTLYCGRDGKPFIRAAARAIESGKIERHKLNINLIDGRHPDLIKEVEKLEISDVVRIVPRIPQEEAFTALAKSHIAVLVGSDMEKIAMTTKVYEYAGMGKPILALVPQGVVHDFVSKCGGWCVDGSDEGGILKIIETIFEQYKRGKFDSGNQCDFVKKYDRRELTKQLSYCFDTCIGQLQ
jgi:glycosyltransferase involved in cell wall biosynthesis